jgi:molybdopterin converting factor subunit 1
MQIQIRLFSIAKDLAGVEEQRLDIEEGEQADAVFRYLETLHPSFRMWQSSMRLAVNHEYVHNNHPLRDGDEVAVIPPVSGG